PAQQGAYGSMAPPAAVQFIEKARWYLRPGMRVRVSGCGLRGLTLSWAGDLTAGVGETEARAATPKATATMPRREKQRNIRVLQGTGQCNIAHAPHRGQRPKRG